MKKFLISASILSANFSRLGEDVSKVVSSGVDLIHFDVMDNHYVPNLSIGSMVLCSLRENGVCVPVDVHLMVTPVLDSLILSFVNAGATFISFHVEATNHVDRSLQFIKECGCKAGLVLNPSTPLSFLEYVMDKLDLIVLMAVNPGFSGQIFLPVILEKIRQARQLIDSNVYDIVLAVDGGIKLDNIVSIANAGANMFIIGSEIFNQSDYQVVINSFRSILFKDKI